MDWTQKLFMEAIWRHTMESQILFWLALRIFYKKGCMIEQAAMKKELDEIVKPSVPHGSCGKFYEGPYHVHEEEMILWSRASLEAPLNEYGYQRYAKVFSMFFPEEAEKIFGSAVTKEAA